MRPKENRRQDEVCDVNKYHRENDGVGRCATNADRSILGSETLLRGDERNDQTENGRFQHATHEIPRLKKLLDGLHEGATWNSRSYRDHISSADARIEGKES